MNTQRISRRTFLQGATATATGVFLAACAAAPVPSESGAAAPAAERVKIRLSGWGNAEEIALYENIAKAHMEEDPTLEIEVIGLPFPDYQQKLFTWIASGDPPDCLRTGTQFFPTLWAEDALVDLTPYFEQQAELLDDELYFTELYDIYTMEDRKYGTVLGPNVMLIYYNADLFEQAGVEPPTEEWTYDDYAEAAVRLTSGEGIGKIYGSTNSYGRLVWQGIVWSYGGEMFDQVYFPTKCVLDSPETVEAFRWLQDLVFEHQAAPTAAEASGLEGGWNSGRVAMELGGTWAINARRKIQQFQWDLAHWPQASQRVTCHLAGAVVIAAASQHPDEAWSHTAYYQSDRAQEMFAQDGLNTPMMKKWARSDTFLQLEGAPPHHYYRVDAMEYSRNRDFYFAKWQEVQTKVWDPEMEKLMTNSQTPEETAANMQAGTQALLDA